MITHPAEWDALVASPLMSPRYRVTAYKGASTLDVPVTDGQVVINARQYPRTMVTVQCADSTIIPHTLTDLLQPFGSRLKVETGYADAAGTVTWVTIADCVLVKTTVTRPGGLIELEAWDDAYLVACNAMLNPTGGYGGVITACTYLINLVQNATGVGTTVVNTATDVMLPTDYTWAGGDTWAACLELADLCRAEILFDQARRLIIRPQPVVGTPVYVFETGPKGTITMYESTQSRPYNVVYVPFVDLTGAPWTFTGTWNDTTSTSSVAAIGPNVYIAPTLTGKPGAALANVFANNVAGRVRRARTVRLEAVPVPWLEPGDTVGVQTVGGPLESHLVSGVTFPLAGRPMSLTTQDPTYTGPL